MGLLRKNWKDGSVNASLPALIDGVLIFACRPADGNKLKK